ncbi:MAG TPA: glycosyltransferase family 2 protein [Tepidisphaeraceae bacterium]|nr:glycosyltransferase family 2 protein [Tepidisphaeraceae bacterium]
MIRKQGTIGTENCLPLLTIIIPVYNEVGTIDELLRRVIIVPIEKQIIVVDDGSTDGSGELLRKWSQTGDVLILRHTTNRGKGRAIRTGLQRALGEYSIIQDADLEYDPQDYLHLIHVVQSGAADVVLGSRYLNGTNAQVGYWFRLGVSVLNMIVKLLYHVTLTDEATCYKATTTAILRRMDLQCERFEFCPELVAKACRMNLRIREVAISYYPRNAEAGKKIRLKDGWAAACALWRWRKWVEGSNSLVPSQQPGRGSGLLDAKHEEFVPGPCEIAAEVES